MAISREQKEAFVADYVEKLSRSQAAYIADYRGLSVSDISTLRTNLRESGDNELTVAKNTLLRIALEQSGLPIPEAQLEGPTAVLFCFDDPITPAKALKKYSDKSDFLSVKGGLVDGRVVDTAGFEAMADLPSREEILGTLVGMIQAPAQELFGTMIAPMREIAQVLHAHSEQGE